MQSDLNACEHNIGEICLLRQGKTKQNQNEKKNKNERKKSDRARICFTATNKMH